MQLLGHILKGKQTLFHARGATSGSRALAFTAIVSPVRVRALVSTARQRILDRRKQHAKRDGSKCGAAHAGGWHRWRRALAL